MPSLTNSVEQNPAWEDNNSSSAIQEILRILRTKKAHYRVHKSAPYVQILSQTNIVDAPFLFLKYPL